MKGTGMGSIMMALLPARRLPQLDPGLLKSTPGTLQVLGGAGFGEHRRWRT
jgi:hypothetical protein